MKLTYAENLRYFLGDLTGEALRVYAFNSDDGGYYEIVGVREQRGAVVLDLGTYHHSLPSEGHTDG